MEVRLEYLMPAEVESAMAVCPTLFFPIGTIEWHGLHNIVGLDTVKAHALCVRAAQQSGGLVHPPLYGGVGGLDEPHTFVFEPENNPKSDLLRSWLEKFCHEAKRNGFKAVIILTGHYGAAQQIVVRTTAAQMTKALGIPVLGTPEYFLALDEKYYGDHAAFFETSIMMHFFPDYVDVHRLGQEPHKGVGGLDPKRHANPGDGKRLCDAIVSRLATLAKAMPNWDAKMVDRFQRMEATLAKRQLQKAQKHGNVWSAWGRISKGIFDVYPEALVSGQFEDILAAIDKL
jgi:creatinine amidohydrolase